MKARQLKRVTLAPTLRKADQTIGSYARPVISSRVPLLKSRDTLSDVRNAIVKMNTSGELPGIRSVVRPSGTIEIRYTGVKPPVTVGHAIEAKPEPFCGIASSGLDWSALATQIFCFRDVDGEGIRYVALVDVLRNPAICSSPDEFAEISRGIEDFQRTLRRNTLGFSRPTGEEYSVKQKIVDMLRAGYQQRFGRTAKSKGYLSSVDLPVIELEETVETIYQRKDVNWEHLLMPHRWETSSKLLEVKTIIPETGFGAYREWWVHNQLCKWSEELGLVRGKDFDIGIFPGTCIEGVIPDTERAKTKYPDFAYLFPPSESKILFFLEVGGDSGYYMIPEIEKPLGDKFKVQQARAGYQKTLRLFDNETGGWNFNRGYRIMDNIPKIASLRTFDAPTFYVYVCDLFNAIPLKKEEKLERHDVEVPVFEESSNLFHPGQRTRTCYTYEKELPIIHAFCIEANEFVENATHFFGKKYGTRIGKQGRTMEPKIQIDLRESKPVDFFMTRFHEASFKRILRNIVDLHKKFKANGSCVGQSEPN